jgi:hypothetical protein
MSISIYQKGPKNINPKSHEGSPRQRIKEEKYLPVLKAGSQSAMQVITDYKRYAISSGHTFWSPRPSKGNQSMGLLS